MILLIGVLLGCYLAWQVRHYGLYLALCDALAVTLSAVAAIAYVGKLAELVPMEHALKGTGCLLAIWLIAWIALRTVLRSFPGDTGVAFPKPVDHFGAMLITFGGTMVSVAMVSLLVLTTGELLKQVETFVPQLRQTAEIAVTVARSVGAIAGATEPITLDRVIEITTSS